MRFLEGFKVVRMAYNKVDREKWFQIWLVRQPDDGTHMIPFDTWYDSQLKAAVQQNKNNQMSDEEIIQHAMRIKERLVKK